MTDLTHEFRTYDSRTDEIYDHMMMCRDKTILAVNRYRLTREAQWVMSLHDPTFRFIEDESTGKGQIQMNDWSSHGIYQNVLIEGSFDEKMEHMHKSLNEGQEVYIGTIHPHLPFSARYNPALSEENYDYPNHIFAILAETEAEYVYFDTSSIKSTRFIPYSKNPELGVIRKEIVDRELKKLFQLAVLEWHDDMAIRLKSYPLMLLQRFARENKETQKEQENQKVYTGIEGIERFREWILSKEKLKEPDLFYHFLDIAEILNWKLKDVWTRRFLFGRWEEQKQRNAVIADAFFASQHAWERLAMALLYMEGRRLPIEHKKIDYLLQEVMQEEDNLMSVVRKEYLISPSAADALSPTPGGQPCTAGWRR